MSYSSKNPPFLVAPAVAGGANGAAKGGNIWVYRSADTIATVSATHYFVDGATDGMQVADVVIVVDTATPAVSLCTVIDVSTTLGATVKATAAATSGTSSTVSVFDTRTSAAAATISTSVKAVSTQGYTSAGDLGDQTYIGGTSTDIGAFQSADGAWWKPVAHPLRPEQFGAKGDGTTDDITAINNMIALAAQWYLAGGDMAEMVLSARYKVSAPVQLWAESSPGVIASYSSFLLRGETHPYSASPSRGPAIIASYFDRPNIIVASSRYTKLQNFELCRTTHLPGPNNAALIYTGGNPGASFTATIDNGSGSSGNRLTLASSITGTITIGDGLYGQGIPAGTTISAGSGNSWTITPALASGSPVSVAVRMSCGGTGAGATFYATAALGVLTISNSLGIPIAAGQDLSGPGVPAGTTIVSNAGAYWTISQSALVASSAMSTSASAGSNKIAVAGYIDNGAGSAGNTLTLTSGGPLYVGQVLYGVGVYPGTTITAALTSTTYTIANAQGGTALVATVGAPQSFTAYYPWYNFNGAWTDQQYSMAAGISIDPFSSNAANDAGGYAGLTSYYSGSNKGGSSYGITIDGLTIYDNIVGIMAGASSDVQQNDTLTVNNCNIQNNRVGVAIGQGQSRGCKIVDTDFIGVETACSGGVYGKQAGVMPIIDGGASAIVKWFMDFNTGDTGRGSLRGAYCEALGSVGFFGKTPYPIDISDCMFKTMSQMQMSANSGSVPRLPTLTCTNANLSGGTLSFYNGAAPGDRSFIINNGHLTITGTAFDNQPLIHDQYNVSIVSIPGIAYSRKSVFSTGAGTPTRGFYVPSGGEAVTSNGELFKTNPGSPEGFVQLEASVAITNYGDGTGAFTSSDATIYPVGAYITGQSGSAGYTVSVAAGRPQTLAGSNEGNYIGRVVAANPNTNVVSLGEMLAEVKSGSMNILRRELPMFHVRSFGTTSSGTNTLTSVGNIGTWAVGDLISIAKDSDGSNVGPVGAYVTTVTTTTSQLVGSAGAPVAMTTSGGATFNGHIDNGSGSSGNKVTIDNSLVGTITVGHFLTGAGVAAGTTISGGSSSPYTIGAANLTISRNVATSNTGAKLSHANMSMTRPVAYTTYNSTGATGIGVAWKGDFFPAVGAPTNSGLTGWQCAATGNPSTMVPVYGNSNTIVLTIPGLSTKASDGAVGYAIAPMGYKVSTIYAVLNGALATADGTATFAINGTGITTGVITLTNAGSAAGSKYSASPTALNTGVAGDVIRVTVGGGSTATATGNFYAVLVSNP